MKLSAHTDGASKGNPGPAAFGYSIEKDNVVLEEYFEYIGETTNNSAEYRAFIAVLKRMKEL
ncbi:MAG TPA: RNase H family protein, partial [Anaerolineae bacterium]|nr:RNase H family protein [Anaerolineae bacterium]